MGKRLRVVAVLCLIGLLGGASEVTPTDPDPGVEVFSPQCDQQGLGGTYSNGDCVGNQSDC